MNERHPGPVLSARNVSREFSVGSETVHAVRDVTVDVYPGEMVALLGRSGSGKTSLLNLLGGLDNPTDGVVDFEGRDLARMSAGELAAVRRTKLGFVFQSFGLLPLLSAHENVELPLRIAGLGRREQERMTRAALDTVGLLHRTRHRPYELSGGEQQRVAIARAIVLRPQLILADEPTAELDSSTSRAIFTLLSDVVVTDQMTVVVATHDRVVLDVAHRVLELEDGELVRFYKTGEEEAPQPKAEVIELQPEAAEPDAALGPAHWARPGAEPARTVEAAPPEAVADEPTEEPAPDPDESGDAEPEGDPEPEISPWARPLDR